MNEPFFVRMILLYKWINNLIATGKDTFIDYV